MLNIINIKNSDLNKSVVRFNPFLPEFHQNPYPFYHQLRMFDPTHKSFFGAWVLTRYADVRAVLRDSRFRSDEVPNQIKDKKRYFKDPTSVLTLATITSKWLFFLDPPDHTRLRSLLNKFFSTQWIESMRPLIQSTVDDLLDNVRYQGYMDIIADFSAPLPVIIIANMLGIPSRDHKQLNQWSTMLSRILDPLLSLETYEEMGKVVIQFKKYLQQLIAERRVRREDDLISRLIIIQEENRSFSEEELLATCMVLFVTGEETVVNLIGNGMAALFQHSQQMEKLINTPSLIKNAVDELLRYDSPLQQTARIANCDIRINNKVIRAGEKVLVSLGAANRDPDQFHNPDILDIERINTQHVGFGGGIHNCLGITLARVQAQIAINSLLQQLPLLKLNINRLEWQEHIALRRLKSLPVKFEAINSLNKYSGLR